MATRQANVCVCVWQGVKRSAPSQLEQPPSFLLSSLSCPRSPGIAVPASLGLLAPHPGLPSFTTVTFGNFLQHKCFPTLGIFLIVCPAWTPLLPISLLLSYVPARSQLTCHFFGDAFPNTGPQVRIRPPSYMQLLYCSAAIVTHYQSIDLIICSMSARPARLGACWGRNRVRIATAVTSCTVPGIQ